MELVGICVENVRSFAGGHYVALDPRLNVFAGKNNVGKSTLLRVPSYVARVLLHGPSAEVDNALKRAGCESYGFRVRLQCSPQEFRQIAAESRLNVLSIRDEPSGITDWTHLAQTPEFQHLFGADHTAVTLEVGYRQDPSARNIHIRILANPGATQKRIESIDWWGAVRLTFAGGRTGTPESRNRMDFGTIVTGLRSAFESAPFVEWAHRPFGVGATYGQPHRRLQSDDEEEVKQTLTFLKMKHHEAHFSRLDEALRRALPEFGSLDFADQGAYDYRPSFRIAAESSGRLLTRDLVGSGSWTFLAIMAAAHAAAATGAQTLVLDEPHLYLHPGLERRLVYELQSGDRWNGRPLKLLVATHSPVFVDAAWRAGSVFYVDWEDEKRSSTHAIALPAAAERKKVQEQISSSLSDILVPVHRV